MSRKCPRNCDPLLLTSRKLRRVMPHAVGHAHALEGFHNSLFALGRWHLLAIGQGQLDVLIDGKIANQIETLKDEADFPVANARTLCEIQVLDWPSIQEVLPARRSVEQPHNREQRGLPTTGWA